MRTKTLFTAFAASIVSASAQQPTFADLHSFEELDGTSLGGVAEFQLPGSPDATSHTITGSSQRFRNLADSRGDDLLFSGTSQAGALAITLSGNLEEPENCLTFTEIELSTTTPDLNVSDLNVSFQQQTVTTEALTPDFPAGDLEFEQVQLSRGSFCQIRHRLFQPSIRLDSNQLVIEFPTTQGSTYTLERSSSLGSFQDMNRTVLGGNGTGNFTLPLDAQKAFFRIRESGR